MPLHYKAQMGVRLAHSLRKSLGQDFGKGISAGPLGRDFDQVRSKGNGTGPHSEKRAYRELARVISPESQ
jgi:hypothetical protein